VAGYIKLSL